MLQRMDETGAPAPAGEVPSMTLGHDLAEAGKAVRTGIPKAWIEAVVLEAGITPDDVLNASSRMTAFALVGDACQIQDRAKLVMISISKR